MTMARSCIEQNYECVVINYRGCAGVPLTTPLCYHACDNAHLCDAIEYIYKDHCCDKQGR
jgi:predicted alpha/beta-fold hydrolase